MEIEPCCSQNSTQRSIVLSTDQGENEANTVPGNFLIDRSLIQEIQHNEQDAELQDLGMELSVYHQDELEQGILAQVDQALEQHEREQEKRRLDKQIKEVTNNIRVAEQKMIQNDVMQRVKQGAMVSILKAMLSRKDNERDKENIAKLRAKQQELTDKRAALDGENQGETTSNVAMLGNDGTGESEQERMIRLGEMTPFGTVLTSSEKGNSGGKLTELEKYLQNQASLEKSRAKSISKPKISVENEPVPSTSKMTPKPKSSALKSSILIPKKRKRKDKLGTKTRKYYRGDPEPENMMSETQTMNLDGNDPDFEPDFDEDDEEYTPKLSRQKKTPIKQVRRKVVHTSPKEKNSDSEWCSDDSDWESSGNERKVLKQRKKGREMDDGETANYNARLRIWEKEIGTRKVETRKLNGGLEIPNVIWEKLYKYQQVGVQWMWELYQNGTGGILGDEMGLGKTIQVIAFMAALKVSHIKDKYTGIRGLGASIIVCPTTVMHQWVREIHNWWPPLRVAILHDSGTFGGSRSQLVKEISQNNGILITSYQGLVKHQDILLKRVWHLLVLDEGHKIRNPDAQATLAAKSIPTPHRIALTGSPMQNNLRELWSLFDFIYPSKLGTLPDFLANFAVPITQGGYANATEVQVATAYHCALTLKETIKPYLLRRMKNDVQNHIHLPNKNEQVLFCKLTDLQRQLYRQYVDSRLVSDIMEGKTRIFVGLINLRKICNHPDLFSGCSKLTQNDESIPKDERYGYWEHSGKMQVVRSLLKIWYKQGHRVLLFTQGRQMMCILENFIQQEGYKYLKLDGTTSISARQPLIAEFNNNPEHFVFLLTTRVGGLGVNLTGADRVVIFDPDWNPATDTQARERAWRIGQERQVTIYRLVTAGTIEEKIYHRQIFKQFLTNKVLNDPRQRRFFKSNDLYELFTLNEGVERGTETSAIFAGTGSEVKVKLKPKKPRAPSPKSVIPNKIEFSKEKIDRMKQLAQKLSQQFSMKLANKHEDKSEEEEENETTKNTNVSLTSSEIVTNTVCEIDSNIKTSFVNPTNDDSHKENVKIEYLLKPVSETLAGSSSSTMERTPQKSKHKERKRHRNKGAKFEGERVSHLVKCRDYAALLKKRGQEEDEEEKCTAESQDDYVLRKLFKKKGLQTALQHDHIMSGGGADIALIEREARHVAQEAVARLKESQRQCFNARAGIPTWTGSRGHIRSPRSATDRSRKKPSAAAGSAIELEVKKTEEEPEELISGSDLLSMWKKRNRLLKVPSTSEPGPSALPPSPELPDEHIQPADDIDISEDEPDSNHEDDVEDQLTENDEARPPSPPPSRPQATTAAPRRSFVTEEETDLLDEIRSFLSFGGSVNGQVSTDELLHRFPESELSSNLAPLFKCMLQSLATFHRNSDGCGIWTLNAEFR